MIVIVCTCLPNNQINCKILFVKKEISEDNNSIILQYLHHCQASNHSKTQQKQRNPTKMIDVSLKKHELNYHV